MPNNNSFRITGQVARIFPTHQGENWKVVTLSVKVPLPTGKENHLDFSAWNKMVDFAESLNVGDRVTVTGYLSKIKNDRNGVWETKLTAQNIQLVSQSQSEAEKRNEKTVMEALEEAQEIPF